MMKAELRKAYKAKRNALTLQEYAQRNEQIFVHFQQRFPITQPITVHCYLSSEEKREASTSLIISYLLNQSQAQVIVPRSHANGTLTHHRFTRDTSLETNQWNIQEPLASEPTVIEKEIDWILVPLLAFSDSGYRVGYGGGYYDRFLPQCRSDAMKIGLSLEPPVGQITDIDQYDIPLDFVVTPTQVFSC
ncbi:5-formyltetrahydrofolate cyclo-ligase [Tunicatimonas pelagia]|uniref:5-formyltetrahydrofolate cyclo-ligase n=1 Tax=Tunicatimonas pelagia TaxID=931531 RepID=UPI002665F73D|nr:5-formyltetrahydrofolate cyclo-ligase [Tunicatimonas pelagia]WKN41603.1 5-formyltetrahydrofolate cyclo-ligase [Tunicatimonas pelagia]